MHAPDGDGKQNCILGTYRKCTTVYAGICAEGEQSCLTSSSWSPCEPQTLPASQPERCTNDVDDDCDGLVDMADGDCVACTSGEPRDCTAVAFGICAEGQQICNDTQTWGVCGPKIRPGAIQEDCDNGLDDDCDDKTDAADEDCEDCTPEATRACSSGLDGVCGAGTQTCGANKLWGLCVANMEPNQRLEDCANHEDDDCDGAVDEADTDCQDCQPTDPPQYCPTGLSGACAAGTQTCDQDNTWGGCTPNVLPGAQVENCDLAGDEDCNGAADQFDPTCIGLPCTGPDGSVLADGASKTYYQTASAPDCGSVLELRACTDGTLSGSYTHATCTNSVTSYTVTPSSGTWDIGYYHQSTPSKFLTISNTGNTSVTVSVVLTSLYEGRYYLQMADAVGVWGSGGVYTIAPGQLRQVAFRTNPDGHPKFYGQYLDTITGAQFYVTLSGHGLTTKLLLKGGYTTDTVSRFWHNLYQQFVQRLPDTSGFQYWMSTSASSTNRHRVDAFYNGITCNLPASGTPCIKTTTCVDQTQRLFRAFYERDDPGVWAARCTTDSAWRDGNIMDRADILASHQEFIDNWGSWQ
ncbi:MAG: hypothetical protein JRH20_23775 [Deltaproteobacteria bacterium]|nr:hypothetical protein [Deltaproteobacteria bacterium]